MTSIISFIDDNAAFLRYCETLQSRPVLALDTEFLRVNTFYPKPGLFQINDGERIVLVDPCSITEWQLFRLVLANPDIVKVFHACDEDIELLYHFLQVDPQGVFDTQVAAAFCGYDYCMGYQRLLKAMLDIDLEKGHSRSDWMQRPLTPEQIQYAADDVRYLLPAYEKLLQQISGRNLLPVIDEEYQATLAAIKETGFDNAHIRIKEAWRLSARQFAVLQALATWREKMMREKDLPRKRIASDDALMALASRTGWTVQQLFEVEGLPSAIARHHGVSMIEMMAQAAQGSPTLKSPKPVKGDAFYHQFKKMLEKQAREFGVDEKMLSKKHVNEAMYWQMQRGDFDLPATLAGWRRPLYQQAVDLFRQELAAKKENDDVSNTDQYLS